MHGAAFYGVPRNAGAITLTRQAWRAPESLPFGDETIVPLRAGEAIRWRVDDAGTSETGTRPL